MRICFFGTPAAAVPTLRALIAAPDVTVVAAVTNPDRPSGRGNRLTPPPVKEAAVSAGLVVWQPRRPREILDELRMLRVDACAVVAYGALLPTDVLDAGGRGFVNLHFSLLPAWRGAAPVQAALLAGETQTGVTCFVLDPGMDTGPVLSSARTQIAPGETAGQLVARLATLGAPVLVDALRGLVAGALHPTPQDDSRASYAPKIADADARLDWARDAVALERAVLAFNPAPGAHTTLAGMRLKVHRAAAIAAPEGGAPPGTVVRVGRAAVASCAAGGLRLDEVQPAGRPRMDGLALMNGYARAGDALRLGDWDSPGVGDPA